MNQLDTLNATLEQVHSSTYMIAGTILDIVACSVLLSIAVGFIYYARKGC